MIKERVRLSILLLVIPICIRCVLLVLNQVTKFEYDFKEQSLNANDIWYPIYYVIYISCFELLPMGLQYLCIRMAIASKKYTVYNENGESEEQTDSKFFYDDSDEEPDSKVDCCLHSTSRDDSSFHNDSYLNETEYKGSEKVVKLNYSEVDSGNKEGYLTSFTEN